MDKKIIDEKELIKLSARELTDMGVCPTCLNKKYNGAVFGDDTNLKLYEDTDIECLFVPNPRAVGHMMISSQTHYHDMSEAPDELNYKMIVFAKQFMIILKEVFKCERVYLCTMSDGPMNHYHIQLIPRYDYEERGSKNFIKPRMPYVFDERSFNKTRQLIKDFANSIKNTSF